eukprot:TRINITY_DN7119_c0_g2_i1.p1 TRINITY_DN7119_c0_g2~~TRINITY_DN7119_c0_g2_i1.p1  ORF type:complete len:214 (-),score=23.81 TRINITY_DN7119_c0_g2_i1:279-920(-)
MAAAKSIRFNFVTDVTEYEVEECAEDFDTCDSSGDIGEHDAVDWSPLESSDTALSDVVAAVNRAKQLRASVEEDLRRTSRSETAPRAEHHAPSAHRSTSLFGQFWRRFSALRKLGACRKQDRSTQSKNAHGRRRWGSIELLQGKHHVKDNKAKEDAWTQSLYGVGPSDSQTGADMDTPGTASVSALSVPEPSPRSWHKKLCCFRTRVCPEVPL